MKNEVAFLKGRPCDQTFANRGLRTRFEVLERKSWDPLFHFDSPWAKLLCILVMLSATVLLASLFGMVARALAGHEGLHPRSMRAHSARDMTLRLEAAVASQQGYAISIPTMSSARWNPINNSASVLMECSTMRVEQQPHPDYEVIAPLSLGQWLRAISVFVAPALLWIWEWLLSIVPVLVGSAFIGTVRAFLWFPRARHSCSVFLLLFSPEQAMHAAGQSQMGRGQHYRRPRSSFDPTSVAFSPHRSIELLGFEPASTMLCESKHCRG